VVLSTGKRVFEHVTRDIPLRLADAEVFAAGAVVLRYEPHQSSPM
jgi:hypothetical protein